VITTWAATADEAFAEAGTDNERAEVTRSLSGCRVCI
jgi:hypothetical protein